VHDCAIQTLSITGNFEHTSMSRFALVALTYAFLTLGPTMGIREENDDGMEGLLGLVNQDSKSDTSMRDAPLVYNKCNMPLAVFLERGFLFNKQVIYPGEAVQLWSPETGPESLPFRIVAMVGDESNLPSGLDSLLNFARRIAVPIAFVGGVVASVSTAGALAGASSAAGSALAPLVANAVKTHAAAGSTAAVTAKKLGNKLVKKYPKAFMAKKNWVWPGSNYFEVTGGPEPDVSEPPPLVIGKIGKSTYNSYNVSTVKMCQALSSSGIVGMQAFEIFGTGDPTINGRWVAGLVHDGRPSYLPLKDVDRIMEWSEEEKVWSIKSVKSTQVSLEYIDIDPLSYQPGPRVQRHTYYQSAINTRSAPSHGWNRLDGKDTHILVRLSVVFTIRNCGDSRLNGDWGLQSTHHGRPQYMLISGNDNDNDHEFIIEYSESRGFWRMTTWKSWLTTFYKAKSDSMTVPFEGWQPVDSPGPAPDLVTPGEEGEEQAAGSLKTSGTEYELVD